MKNIFYVSKSEFVRVLKSSVASRDSRYTELARKGKLNSFEARGLERRLGVAKHLLSLIENQGYIPSSRESSAYFGAGARCEKDEGWGVIDKSLSVGLVQCACCHRKEVEGFIVSYPTYVGRVSPVVCESCGNMILSGVSPRDIPYFKEGEAR